MTNDAHALDATPGGKRPLIASLRHTLILIAVLLTIAAYGVYSRQSGAANGPAPAARGSMLPLYLSLIAAEWGLLRLVLGGLRRAGTPFRELLGARWSSWRDVARDIIIAAASWAAWLGINAATTRFLGEGSAKGLATFLPHGPAEIVAWIALSISAGFCEEAVYRGYLQRQFEALSGSFTVAVLGQAVVFGISHAYQGLTNVAVIAVLGALYGLLARWRKSLKPGMILHAWMDVFGGLLERSF
jgi:membrane protease YdiL (CAAX protease family)